MLYDAFFGPGVITNEATKWDGVKIVYHLAFCCLLADAVSAIVKQSINI